MEQMLARAGQGASLQKPRRLINWWIRWEDLNWPNADIHEKIKRQAEAVARANVTTVILFGAHFRWDYLPYFTILHDYIATVAEELHKYGIECYDRHSVNLIHRYDTREEMRHVILHSGPHLPFSPSREAAASWEYRGKRLNDWRMLDVRTGEPLYYPQYAGEGFCYNNPDYLDAYCDYAKRLVADTGIDGLACEDSVHYMHFQSCGCPHCREALKQRAGIDLPSADDRSFWGNWENPAWHEWIDFRHDTGRHFFERLSAIFPKEFPLIPCGNNSASYSSVGAARDARFHAQGGCNYVHSELCGNTPPYKGDPVTWNYPISHHVVGFSHHQAVTREFGVRSFSTGYGFTEPAANIIWAVNKVLDTDCLFSTLKARLGLPDHVLETLPEAPQVIGRAFTFEKEHAELFGGRSLAQVGVFYADKTRDHTYFGNLARGYYADYSKTLSLFFGAGISADTLFTFPEDPSQYAVVVVPSALAMREEEMASMHRYLAAGGRVLVCGPSCLPECENQWSLPTSPDLASPEEFFDTIADGVSHRHAPWKLQTKLSPSTEPCEWRETADGMLYNPHRVSDGALNESLVALVRERVTVPPVEVLSSHGYLITMFETEKDRIVHFLAEDYDTDIDHGLDEIRFHRSRVNYINKVEPIGVCDTVRVESDREPRVFLPFSNEAPSIKRKDGSYAVTLPHGTSYAILHFPNTI